MATLRWWVEVDEGSPFQVEAPTNWQAAETAVARVFEDRGVAYDGETTDVAVWEVDPLKPVAVIYHYDVAVQVTWRFSAIAKERE